MTDKQMLVAILVTILVVTAWVAVVNKRREKRELMERLCSEYATPFCNEHSHEHLTSLHDITLSEETDVGDETWHDLNMDRVFSFLDQSVSAVGEEYLYLTLHRIEKNEELLKKRGQLASELSDRDLSLELRKKLSFTGKQKRYTIHRFINIMLGAEARSSLLHILLLTVFIISFVLMFIKPAVGVTLCLLSAMVNCITYFWAKSSIAGYNYSIENIVRWLSMADGIKSIKTAADKPVLNERISEISELSKHFNGIRRVSWMFAPQNAVSSIIDIIFDYLKFLTHLDIIAFNYLVKYLGIHKEELRKLYFESGELELGSIIASVRDYQAVSCEPVLENGLLAVKAEQMIHPLLPEPVPNDVMLVKNALITGSNASGKSTFLKMVSLNCLLSQSLYTVFARSYRAGFLDIRTSFDISDDLTKGDSFYVAEIKRLKSILDFSSESKGTLICIDEILKGTNTTERIAASSEILKYLSKSKCLVLAATHDVELTELLEPEYENYYFTENPDNEDNIFDYRLYRGKNYTGNAIRMLSVYGFPKEIIEGSYKNIREKN